MTALSLSSSPLSAEPEVVGSTSLTVHRETCREALVNSHKEVLGTEPSLTSKFGIRCRKQVMKTTEGQSSGCIITRAA